MSPREFPIWNETQRRHNVVDVIATKAQKESGISDEGMRMIVTSIHSEKKGDDSPGSVESRRKIYEVVTASFVSMRLMCGVAIKDLP